MSLIDLMNLTEFKDILSKNLSGGNKRKLSVAIALICNPPIILLDEPSTGMDPEARRYMWKIIHDISIYRKKSTIIMTTHSMEEAETLCEKIGILVKGELLCLGTSDEIKDTYGYGFEINFQINKPDINDVYKIFFVNDEDKEQIIYLNCLDECFRIYYLDKYKTQLKEGLLGGKLLDEINSKGYIPFKKILLWIYNIKCVLSMINMIKPYFNEIHCIDYDENNFVFKIKRNKTKDEKSIGFLFGLIEDNKNKFNIGPYYLRYSSLENIFNIFARINGDNNYINYQKDIEITQDLLDNFLKKSAIFFCLLAISFLSLSFLERLLSILYAFIVSRVA
jgi:ATP-binding cassette subfamily A (ABC1) protein 3